MNVKVTYYLEVISSWCAWAEPAWAEPNQRYADRVGFGWKIALMPPEAYPVSKSQCEWFLLENNIGDRVVFSGVVTAAPISAAIDALLQDVAAYASYAAHFGPPPPA